MLLFFNNLVNLEERFMTGSSKLPDVQNRGDERGISIDRVGITNVYFPIKVRRKEGGFSPVSARTKLFVGLPKDFKGANLSRFMETLVAYDEHSISFHTLQGLLEGLCKAHKSDDAYARFEFDYFIEKTSPVSKKKAPQNYRCAFTGILKGDVYEFILEVNVVAASLCPCSREMSLIENLDAEKDLKLSHVDKVKLEDIDIDRKVGMGAHNQRSIIRVRLTPKDKQMIWIEDIVTLIEEQASAPTYPILKRADEKFVTEQAYNNPKFSEDITRDIQLALESLADVEAWSLRVYNEESIHAFDVSCYQKSPNWKH
jgi:GTP cyclohydrolase I